MEAEQRRQLESLRQAHIQQLQMLEQRATSLGTDTQPKLLAEIAELRSAIATIEVQLGIDVQSTVLSATATPSGQQPHQITFQSPLSTESWDYLDFELEIRPNAAHEYLIRVIRSPAGETQEVTQFAIDDLSLENRLQSLQIALLRSATIHRQILTSNEQIVRDFGRDLFDRFITGNVRVCYEVSRREAASQTKKLRLKLLLHQPELAILPWEFLYDDQRTEYVCLSRAVSVVRYLEVPQPIQPLTVVPPVRILALIASPRDLPALNIEREKRLIEAATGKLQKQGLVQITWLDPGTWRDLQRALRQGPWHIFHFIGHGGFNRNSDEGFIAISDENGETYRLTASNLARLLADHESLRLTILNACEGARAGKFDIFSSTAAILVRRGVPAVLAMQYAITDQAAIEFTSAFYEALADQLPVDAATVEARKAISLAFSNDLEWGVPVLYMHTPDGKLFNFHGYGAERTRHNVAQPFSDTLRGHSVQNVAPSRRVKAWPMISWRQWLLPALLIAFILAGVSLAALPLECSTGLQAENWQAVNIPFDDVNQLIVNVKIPDTLYAGTLAHGALRSPDGGVTWQPLKIALGETSVTKITVDFENPSIIYIATAGKGIFKSADNGLNWSPINNNLPVLDIRDIAIDPNQHNTVYIGSWGAGVLKSVNGGDSWEQINTGLADTTVQSLAIDPRQGHILYAGTHNSGIFVTRDAGRSWSQTTLQRADVRGVTTSLRDSQLIFASTWGDGIYISKDGGAHWNASNTGITDFSLRSPVVNDPQYDHILYVGSWSGGLFATINEGASWYAVNAEPKVIRAITTDGNDIFIASRSGVYSFTRTKKTILNCLS